MGVFTREEEELLRYDADAFLYFALCILTTVLLPWTWFLAKSIWHPKPPTEEDYDLRGVAKPGTIVRRCTTSHMEEKRRRALEMTRSWKYRLGGTIKMQLLVLIVLWVCLVVVVFRVSTAAPELRTFDPYVILDIPRDADAASIKRAYRKKSLELHPDKNPDDPMAAAMFQQVAKAQAALTEESARRNYAKYGNPDGPSQMKVGIALHPAMLGGKQPEKESQRRTLIVFFLLLFLPPLCLVCCCLGGTSSSASGVCGETLRIYNACVDAEVRAEDGPGLLAASVEARRIYFSDLRPLLKAMSASHPVPLQEGTVVEVTSGAQLVGRMAQIRTVGDLVCKVDLLPETRPAPGQRPPLESKELSRKCLTVIEPNAPCPFSDQPIRRHSALLWAHMRRLHNCMAPLVQAELTALLRQAPRLGRAMASVAARGEGDRAERLEALRGILCFRRCLVQALEPGDSPLLQVPHVEKSKLPPGPAPSMHELVAPGGADSLVKRLKLTPEQGLDVQAFCHHAPRIELTCTVEVEDEKDIAEGDLATLTVRLLRANLAEGEAAGPVHAPLFPMPKFEEWWLVVYDEGSKSLVAADMVLGNGREEVSKVRFMVPRAGSFCWRVLALCDSYLGLDVDREVRFTALKKSEVNHEIFVHPADRNIRSLFEEIMQGLQPPEVDSESESDDEPSSKAKEAALAPAEAAKARADSSDDAEEVEEGTFYRAAPAGNHLYRRAREEEELRAGTMPAGMVFRGLGGNGRPDGWLELPGSGAWMPLSPTLGAAAGDGGGAQGSGGGGGALPPGPELLGGLKEVRLGALVQTVTPMRLVRRWLRTSVHEVDAEDLRRLREIDEPRARSMVEEMVRGKLGDERFGAVLDQALEERRLRERRILGARGFFSTQNGIVWRVDPSGMASGLAPDGSKLRDKVKASEDDKIELGPFRLDEARSSSCLYWQRKDDPQKGWIWTRDRTLQTRVRIGTAFPGGR